MAEQVVRLENVSRIFGATRAVDHVNLEIARGEFFTLLGASGSGKTTTLRLIGGFESPDEGRVIISGEDVTQIPAYKRNVHTVFQDYALFPHLTVEENVAFALRLKHLPNEEVQRRVSVALAMVQLPALGQRKTSQISGGQQQRVALARSIVDQPAVLLLDEPLSALDAKIRAELREELKRLQRETKITFVYVTHDQEEALTLSDRLAVMRGGRVLQVGTPLEVYEHPADLFVAEFIGKANFLTGTVADIRERKAMVDVDGRMVEASVAAKITPGSAVRVMIRPENMRLAQQTPSAVFQGVVRHSLYQGHATEYLIRSESIVFRVLELRRRGAVPYAEGAHVSLSWNWEEALVYPVNPEQTP